MKELSTLETVLLKLVVKGNGKWGWYQLETRLSMLDVPRVPDPISALKSMEVMGLVQHHVTIGSARDSWEITKEGIAALSQMDLPDE